MASDQPFEVKRAFQNVAASTTDQNLVSAVAGKRIRVLAAAFVGGTGVGAGVTFNTKGGGAGAAISPLYTTSANGGSVLPYNPVGWFETTLGEGLTATTGSGTTTGLNVCYVEV